MGLEEILNGCRVNDVGAQERLYRMFSAKLFGVCLKYSRSHAEAEDHLQDGFMIIYQKISQYTNSGSFEGWAKRIMVNNVLQQYRTNKRLEVVTDEYPDQPEVEIDDENVSLDFLLKIIQELPERYRLVFNLYVIDGYNHQEIADMIGISLGTSKSNLSRAKAILKEKIESTGSNLTSAK